MLKLIDFQGFGWTKIEVLKEQIRSYLWKLFTIQSHTSVNHWSMPILAEFLACSHNYNKMYNWNNTKMGCWNLASKILWFQGFLGFFKVSYPFSRFFSRFCKFKVNSRFSRFFKVFRVGYKPCYPITLWLDLKWPEKQWAQNGRSEIGDFCPKSFFWNFFV